MTTPLYIGACLCGGVSFTMMAEPSGINNCFCTDCRKNAGGPMQTNAEWAGDVMQITDADKLVTTYIITDTASGRPKIKCFCKRCGCTLWTLYEKGDMVFRNVRVGLIEDGYVHARLSSAVLHFGAG
ncbi:hypothetical protein CALCODRAFT_442262 [Calocera cornea HHB12733]|uniref:CENP-V/GFA domain-containing protein n=1 Tax=Calocera cornea HHB12733 TaxID=1353952 RepID=A0A165D3K3_9BASI|nr:hypothetical protein CALCODRAFT_442262 [Calocera cornea HHB12733]